MHILKIPANITEPIPTIYGREMEAGKSYLATNAFVGNMLQSRWRVVIDEKMWALNILLKAQPYSEPLFQYVLGRMKMTHLYLIRGGGWGDLLAMTPLIQEIKRKWPKLKLNIACGTQYHELFEGIDINPCLLPIPYPLPRGHHTVSFEETVEGTPDAERYHIARLFGRQMGIELNDTRPTYILDKSEKDWAESKFAKNGQPRIGVQFLASALYRSYPHVETVIKELAKEAEVFIFGTPGQTQLKEKIPNVTNLMEHKLSFRQSAAVLSTCDVCVAPDSALIHLSSALDIPCIALYGPFPAKLRISGENTYAFQGDAPCAPCFYHAQDPADFPYGMPCYKVGRCVAMEQIDPMEVVASALALTKSPNSNRITPVQLSGSRL